MSINDTLTTPTSTPFLYNYSQIPMQFVVIVLAVIAFAFIAMVLFYWVYSRNVGHKVYFKFYQTPDKKIQCRHYFHEIGSNPPKKEFNDAAEAVNYVQGILKEMYGE